MRHRLRYWLIRRVLKSAAVFEEDLSASYAALLEKLKSDPAGAPLARLWEEEKLHLEMIRRLARGPVSSGELDRLIAGAHFHDPEEVAPLPPALRAAFADRLERLQELERESYIFYSNLARISKLPSVKKSFAFLADQERQHLLLVQRLLDGGDAPETPKKS
jgi:rubrerythrin